MHGVRKVMCICLIYIVVFHSISCSLPPVVMSRLPSQHFMELSELQKEATYEVVGQPRPLPPADYCFTSSAAYESTDFNTDSK